jgi:hypothetical protein
MFYHYDVWLTDETGYFSTITKVGIAPMPVEEYDMLAPRQTVCGSTRIADRPCGKSSRNSWPRRFQRIVPAHAKRGD